MADLFVKQFLTGFIDGCRLPKAIETIAGHDEVKRLTIRAMLISGLLYLTSDQLYCYFASHLFHEDIKGCKIGDHVHSFRTMVFLGGSWWHTIVHFCWTIGMYLTMFSLSGAWVQQIFDHLVASHPIDFRANFLSEIDINDVT